MTGPTRCFRPEIRKVAKNRVETPAPLSAALPDDDRAARQEIATPPH
jgi:hypothetical protein